MPKAPRKKKGSRRPKAKPVHPVAAARQRLTAAVGALVRAYDKTYDEGDAPPGDAATIDLFSEACSLTRWWNEPKSSVEETAMYEELDGLFHAVAQDDQAAFAPRAGMTMVH